MKTKLYLFVLALVAFITSCEKEIDIKTSFPFTIESNFKESVIINTKNEVSFNLTPEQIVTSNVYTMSYRVLTGQGSFYLEDGTLLLENEITLLNGLSIKPLFSSQTIGDTQIEITFSDQQGEEETEIINLITIDNPFSVELNTVSTIATINESKDFSLILINTGEDKSTTYKASLFISQGTGTIELLDSDGNLVEVLDQNKTFDITPGTHNYSITLNNAGVNILEVNITDSNGQESNDAIEFAVDVINFNFTGEPTSNTAALGNEVEINFNLNETDGGNADYQMRYILSEGDADIYIGANEILAGTNVDVNLGAFTWDFRPTEIGDITLKFVVSNNTGVEKEIDVIINVEDRSFDFSATRTLASLPLGESVNINYIISETGGSEQDNYTMTYTSTSNGTIVINGEEFQPGTTINLPTLNFVATYTGNSFGEHVITSVITSLSNNITVEKDVEIEYLASEFTLDVNSLDELTVNETIDVEFILNETVGESTFDIEYSITGVEQEFRNSSNIILEKNREYDVESNTFRWSLKAIRAGSVTITYTVKNQFDFIETQEITYTINPIQFDFSTSVVGSGHLTESAIQFNFNMNADSSLTYRLKFESNGDGFVNYNGRSFNENVYFDVPFNNFNVNYFSVKGGVNVINWTILASNGITKTETTNVSVSQFPKISSFTVQESGISCDGGFNSLQTININWTKDEQVFIERIVLTWFDDDNNRSEIETINLNSNRDRINFTQNRCPPGFFISQNRDRIRVQIFDNLDRESNIITNQI